MRSLLFIALASILVGCQSTPSQPPPMSLEEAKKVSAEFQTSDVVAPPHRIDDIAGVLEHEQVDESFHKALLQRLNATTTDSSPEALAVVHHERANAALNLGLM